MLSKTPLLNALDMTTYGKACQKVAIETLPKTPPTLLFQKQTVSKLSSKSNVQWCCPKHNQELAIKK